MSLDPKYLSKERLEARAEKELEKFAGGAQLVAPIPLDVDSFAEFHLGAALDYQRLSSDGSVLGMSIFQELSIPVFESTGARVDIVFPERTIVIDDDALRDSPDSRLRFTIAHECAHLLLHRHIYYRDPRMKCKGGTGYRPFTTTSEGVRADNKVDRAEFQANYLGAALLMPRDPFSQAFTELAPEGWRSLDERRKRRVVRELARTFEVSKQAAAIRIKNLNLAA